MNVQRIMCPTDFSESSKAAVGYASSLALHFGAILHIVHVDEHPLLYGTAPVPYPDEMNANREQLAETKPTIGGVPFEQHLLRGIAADEIARFAEKYDVDLIVIGTHGRTGLRRLLMGSVAESVVRHAKCPVLAVKHPVVVPQPAFN